MDKICPQILGTSPYCRQENSERFCKDVTWVNTALLLPPSDNSQGDNLGQFFFSMRLTQIFTYVNDNYPPFPPSSFSLVLILHSLSNSFPLLLSLSLLELQMNKHIKPAESIECGLYLCVSMAGHCIG